MKVELIGWMGKLTDYFGYGGAILLSICAIPEIINAYITSNVNLTWSFLLLWLFGEIMLLIYTSIKSKKVRLFPLIFNYGLNIACISILIGYKL